MLVTLQVELMCPNLKPSKGIGRSRDIGFLIDLHFAPSRLKLDPNPNHDNVKQERGPNDATSKRIHHWYMI